MGVCRFRFWGRSSVAGLTWSPIQPHWIPLTVLAHARLGHDGGDEVVEPLGVLLRVHSWNLCSRLHWEVSTNETIVHCTASERTCPSVTGIESDMKCPGFHIRILNITKASSTDTEVHVNPVVLLQHKFWICSSHSLTSPSCVTVGLWDTASSFNTKMFFGALYSIPPVLVYSVNIRQPPFFHHYS